MRVVRLPAAKHRRRINADLHASLKSSQTQERGIVVCAGMVPCGEAPFSSTGFCLHLFHPHIPTAKGTTMKRNIILAAAMSIAAIAAHAETPDPSGQFAAPVLKSSKSRSEVLAELKEAQRTGDILASGEGGTLYERNPHAYPPRPVVAGKSRDQVRAETLQAIRDGDIIVGGELGLTARALNPQLYMARNGSGQREHTAKGSPLAPVQLPQ